MKGKINELPDIDTSKYNIDENGNVIRDKRLSKKITIEIPKEFEEHYNRDNFEDSLERIEADIRFRGFLSGLYEVELIEMLRNAFNRS